MIYLSESAQLPELDSKVDAVLNPENVCKPKDEGGRAIYNIDPEFFDKYFEWISCDGLFSKRSPSKFEGRFAYNYEVTNWIPIKDRRAQGLSPSQTVKSREATTYIFSFVTEDSLSNWEASPKSKSSGEKYSVGEKVQVIAPVGSDPVVPYSTDMEDIVKATFIDSDWIKKITEDLKSVLQWAESNKKLSEQGYKIISSEELVQYLLKSKFKNEISVSIDIGGGHVPSKYCTSRYVGRWNSYCGLDQRRVWDNSYSVFVDVSIEDADTMIKQVNDYMNSLRTNTYIKDLDIDISWEKDNVLGGALGGHYYTLGFIVSGPRKLYFPTKTKMLSDVKLEL